MKVSISGLLNSLKLKKRVNKFDAYLLEKFEEHLKELRDRTEVGDMTALDEFFGLYVFDDHKEYKREARG